MKGTKLRGIRLVAAAACVAALTLIGSAASADFVDTFNNGYQSWLKWDGIDTYRVDDNPGELKLATSANSPNAMINVTSKDKFTYGTFNIRFRATNDGWNYLYFGFASRDPWMNPSAMMRLDNSLMLAMGKDGKGNWDALNPNSPVLTANTWHDLSLTWLPDSVSVVYDGTFLGTTTAYVPSTPLPVVLDVTNGQGSTVANVFEVDYVSVTSVPEPSALVSLVVMGGLFGLAIRRRVH